MKLNIEVVGFCKENIGWKYPNQWKIKKFYNDVVNITNKIGYFWNTPGDFRSNQSPETYVGNILGVNSKHST